MRIDNAGSRITILTTFLLVLGATTTAEPVAAEDSESIEAVDAAPLRAADLAPPVRITAEGSPIDVDGFAAPFVGDIDEDGKDDLLVGQLDHGRLRVYRNVGSAGKPKFESFQWFTAGGHTASIPVGCAIGFTPQLVDCDGDGRSDVLTGSFWGSALYLFRRNADGTFAEAEVLANEQGHVRMGDDFPRYNSTVFMCDWDCDGDGDLLVGKSRPCLVANTGTVRQPVFGDAVRLEQDGRELRSGYINPIAADWDGDGRDDLLAGLGRDIVWCRNASRQGEPVLEAPRLLVSAEDLASRVVGDDSEQRQPSSRRPHAICVSDLNADGRLDLLVGDHFYFHRTLSDEQEQAFDESIDQRSAFASRYNDLLRERPKDETTEQLIERFRQALREYRALGTLPWIGGQAGGSSMERHGNVWLYERTDAE